jgi:hypothetical protein
VAPRTVEQLRADAWQAFTKATTDGATVTPHALAKAARLTVGGAHRFLTDWHAEGRAMPLPTAPTPGPHKTEWTAPPVVPAGAVRVLVTGSRDWTHALTITTALARLHTEHGPRLVVVHGACPHGADAIADRWARANGVPVELHPPDWRTHGRAAGPIRNAAMVHSAPALCLAFIRNHSPGATGCARLADDAGIPTTRHDHPATPAPASERSTPAVARTRPKPPPTPAAEPEPQTPEQMRSALRAAALSYAARGWHVFPVRPGDKRPAFPDHPEDRCTGTDPRCQAAGRHVTWEERATTDPDRIGRAWSTTPFGVGIACGPSGLLVVDLDVPKPGQTPPQVWQRPGVVDGADVFAHLCERHGGTDFPDTPTVLTPSDGRHLYYAHPTGPDWPDGVRLGNTAGTLGWLVDTRGWGGYVVAPPTVIDGRAYRMIVHGTTAALPGWIGDALRPTPRPAQQPVSVALTGSGGGSRRDAYLRSAVSAQLNHVAQAVEGERNRALYTSAVALGQLAAGGELDPGQVAQWLTTVAVGAGLDDTEATRTIRSGMRAGAKRPRTLTQEAA